jgi:ABC-type sulfate transport system substrate-binding protein
MDFAENKTREIMGKAIGRYAKDWKCTESSVQILIKPSGEDELAFAICQDYQPKEPVTFKQILNVKIDLISTPFIVKALKKMCEEKGLPDGSVSAMIAKKGEAMKIIAYSSGQAVGVHELSYIFN